MLVASPPEADAFVEALGGAAGGGIEDVSASFPAQEVDPDCPFAGACPGFEDAATKADVSSPDLSLQTIVPFHDKPESAQGAELYSPSPNFLPPSNAEHREEGHFRRDRSPNGQEGVLVIHLDLCPKGGLSWRHLHPVGRRLLRGERDRRCTCVHFGNMP